MWPPTDVMSLLRFPRLLATSSCRRIFFIRPATSSCRHIRCPPCANVPRLPPPSPTVLSRLYSSSTSSTSSATSDPSTAATSDDKPSDDEEYQDDVEEFNRQHGYSDLNREDAQYLELLTTSEDEDEDEDEVNSYARQEENADVPQIPQPASPPQLLPPPDDDEAEELPQSPEESSSDQDGDNGSFFD